MKVPWTPLITLNCVVSVFTSQLFFPCLWKYKTLETLIFSPGISRELAMIELKDISDLVKKF